ncbi:MAG: hypothetical protein IT200_05360 [Thermoleophilia bacterium]|nr:hypothetical protein [Thermoleophilia bacterium]
MDGPARVDVLWLPLGAGGHSVRINGRVWEALSAWRDGRARCDLYHAALRVHLPEGRFAIEQTPVPAGDPAARGVAVEGPVVSPLAGRLRVFRYEIRCWRDGVIPDAAEAVGEPVTVTRAPGRARAVVALVPEVPPLGWGRDPCGAGEMWNSNSIVAWLLTRAGLDADAVTPPPGGRAPGWRTGLLVARGWGPGTAMTRAGTP